ncbi:MAG: hypothetical protein ABFS10_09270 [Bacteroidota bacterium]
MNPPRMWNMARPGFLIPVFFLSFFPGSGQVPWQESTGTALGGCFASRTGMANAMYNQAGLGRMKEHAISLHHARPFLIKELGISSLSLQLPAERGGFGATLSTTGIKGLRQLTSWIGYGLHLHPAIYAGVGINLMDNITLEYGHHLAAGCALGIQTTVRDDLVLGAHVRNPLTWSTMESTTRSAPMELSTGLSYTFFRTATWHVDFQFRGGDRLRWCQGLEIFVTDYFRLLLGLSSAPYTLSGGISLKFRNQGITMATASCFETGITPSLTLYHGW